MNGRRCKKLLFNYPLPPHTPTHSLQPQPDPTYTWLLQHVQALDAACLELYFLAYNRPGSLTWGTTLAHCDNGSTSRIKNLAQQSSFTQLSTSMLSQPPSPQTNSEDGEERRWPRCWPLVLIQTDVFCSTSHRLVSSLCWLDWKSLNTCLVSGSRSLGTHVDPELHSVCRIPIADDTMEGKLPLVPIHIVSFAYSPNVGIPKSPIC